MEFCLQDLFDILTITGSFQIALGTFLYMIATKDLFKEKKWILLIPEANSAVNNEHIVYFAIDWAFFRTLNLRSSIFDNGR